MITGSAPAPRSKRGGVGGHDIEAGRKAEPKDGRRDEHHPSRERTAPELSHEDNEDQDSQCRKVRAELKEAQPARHVQCRAIGRCRGVHRCRDNVQCIRGEQDDHQLDDYCNRCHHVESIS